VPRTEHKDAIVHLVGDVTQVCNGKDATDGHGYLVDRVPADLLWVVGWIMNLWAYVRQGLVGELDLLIIKEHTYNPLLQQIPTLSGKG